MKKVATGGVHFCQRIRLAREDGRHYQRSAEYQQEAGVNVFDRVAHPGGQRCRAFR